MQPYLLGAVLAVNLLTFAAFGLDKWKARTRRFRIREQDLLVLAALGGAIGAWCGMSMFRHKSRKRSFRVKLFLATTCNLLWIWLWWTYARS